MNATEQDVRECYRVLLSREAESDEIVLRHLADNPSVVQLAKRFVDSAEYKRRFVFNSHISMGKCFEAAYLAKGLDLQSKVSIFSYHYYVLANQLRAEEFSNVILGEPPLLSIERTNAYSVNLTASKAELNEGELSVSLVLSGRFFYRVGLTFAPAWVFGSPGETVGLITKIQGVRGTQALFKQCCQDWDDVEPGILLYECARGIAKAVGAGHIVGVSGAKHVGYEAKYADAFRKSYDDFFLAHGFSKLNDSFYRLPLGVEPRVNPNLSPSHRKRSQRRQALREDIANRAGQAWMSWRPQPRSAGGDASADSAAAVEKALLAMAAE